MESGVCPKCARPLPASVPLGLCAECLLASALEEPSASSLDDSPTAPGRQFGDYQILCEIARGGMGLVFKARQQSLNRLVALKVIGSEAFISREFVQRFRTEAEAAASLDHPNIVPIYEIGEHEGQHYFSMKLVEGGSLADRLSRVKDKVSDVCSLKRYVVLISIVARAVHYAHQRGVLHRDIKPGNILIDSQGEPHLTDFGLAKLLEKESTVTHSKALLGTPSYMPPEQTGGQVRNLTTAADIYGLGAVLYELLTGQPPFAGASTLETIRLVLDKAPRLPHLLNPNVDRDLETICLKCLEKHPHRRYESALALAEDLERWGRHETIVARRAPAGERFSRWVRRHPLLAGLTMSLCLTILAGFIGITWQWRRAQRESFSAREAARLLRLQSYATDMKIAHVALEEKNLGRAAELVRKWFPKPGEEDRRGLDWRYLWQQTQGDELKVFQHETLVWNATFSPNGRFLAASAFNEKVLIWDIASEKVVARFDGPDHFHSIAFSPDGKFLAVGRPGETHIRDTSGWQLVRTLDHGAIGLDWSPDGNFIAAFHRSLVVWDTHAWARAVLTTNTNAIASIRFAPDHRLVVANAEGVDVWDTSNRSRIKRYDYIRGGFRLTTSRDGKWFAVRDKGRLTVAALDTGEILAQWNPHGTWIHGIEFTPDSQFLATSGGDHQICFWELSRAGPWENEPNRKELKKVSSLKGHLSEPWELKFSSDGRLLASTGKDAVVRLWPGRPITNQVPSVKLPPHARVLGFASHTNALWTVSNKALFQLWDLADGRELARFSEVNPMGFKPFSDSPATIQGDLLALPIGDGVIEIWNWKTRHRHRRLQTGTTAVKAVRFSPDGTRLFVINPNVPRGTLWDLKTLTAIASFDFDAEALLNVHRVAFSPDSRLLAYAGTNYTVKVWDIATHRDVHTFRRQLWTLYCVGFSPDGKLLATSAWDNQMRVWDLTTGRERFPGQHSHLASVRVFHFTPDGRSLIAGDDDKVCIWDVATGQETVSIASKILSEGILSANGNTLLLGKESSGTLRLLRLPGLPEIDAREATRPKAEAHVYFP